MTETGTHERADQDGRRAPREYWELARRLLASSFTGTPVREFAGEVARELLAFTGARSADVALRTRTDRLRCRCRDTGPGGLECLELAPDAPAAPGGEHGPGVVVLRLGNGGDDEGTLVLTRDAPFGAGEQELLGQLASHLTLALQERRTHASLRERVKELRSLYDIALLVEQPLSSLAELLDGIVAVIPRAMLHPEAAWVRLDLDGRTHTAGASVAPSGPTLSATISIGGRQRGRLTVGYAAPMPPLDIGPFVLEERSLVDTIGREIALVVERREVGDATQRLQDQLIHTERLATIGELAAGIAHELNDPLNNILGYAQLVAKQPDVPDQARRDMRVIVDSALHTRQVIQQLLMFARRMPQRRTHVRLVDVIEDAMPFLQALCAKSGARLELELARNLPTLFADPDQLRQVVVNLVVNATQAMPSGGVVRIAVEEAGGHQLRLTVSDSGTGMPPEVAARALQPFYTTRAEGTGMGLSVVEGIVTAHGGAISLDSTPGRGTTFELLFPLEPAT